MVNVYQSIQLVEDDNQLFLRGVMTNGVKNDGVLIFKWCCGFGYGQIKHQRLYGNFEAFTADATVQLVFV